MNSTTSFLNADRTTSSLDTIECSLNRRLRRYKRLRQHINRWNGTVRSLLFCLRVYLVENDCTVYISHLTRLEYLEAIRALAHKQSLPESFRSSFDLAKWESFMVRQRWLEFWANQFDELLDTFYLVYELPYRQRIWTQAPQVMALTAMRAYDAFHVATATSYGIPELWTTDADLARNPGGIRVRLLR